MNWTIRETLIDSTKTLIAICQLYVNCINILTPKRILYEFQCIHTYMNCSMKLVSKTVSTVCNIQKEAYYMIFY